MKQILFHKRIHANKQNVNTTLNQVNTTQLEERISMLEEKLSRYLKNTNVCQNKRSVRGQVTGMSS